MNNIKVIITQEQFDNLVRERIKSWIYDDDVFNAYYNYLKPQLEQLFNLDDIITIDINDYLDNIIINNTYHYERKKQLKEYDECLKFKTRAITKSDLFDKVVYINSNVAICR